MVGLLPEDIAVVVLGPGGAALGRRLRKALAGARLHGPRARPGEVARARPARDEAHVELGEERGQPGARLHLYGKREAKPGRKMGHVTRLKPLPASLRR